MACFSFSNQLGKDIRFKEGRGGEGRTFSEKTMLQLMDTATIYCPAEQNLLSNSSLFLLIFVRLTWISVSRGLGWQFGANESCFGDNWCDEPGPSLMCVEPGSSPGPERECERFCQNAFSVLKKVWSSSKSLCLLQPTKLYTNKDGTLLREISSCCCLTTAGKTRQLLLNKIYIPFLPSLPSL